MRRDSTPARQLVALAAECSLTIRGRPITGRYLEDLDAQGLLIDTPAEHPEQLLANLRELDALDYGQGKDADDIAVRLLARGVPVKRAATVIGPLSDLIPRMLQQIRTAGPEKREALASIVADVPSYTKTVQDALYAAVDDVPDSGRIDYAGAAIVETPEQRRQQVDSAAVSILSGQSGDIADVLWDVTVGSPSRIFHQLPTERYAERPATPDELDAAEAALNNVSDTLSAAGSPSLAEIATAARVMNAALSSLAVIPFTDRDRERFAAISAPLLARCLRQPASPPPPSTTP